MKSLSLGSPTETSMIVESPASQKSIRGSKSLAAALGASLAGYAAAFVWCVRHF